MPDNNININNNDNNNMTIITFFIKSNSYHQLLSLLQKSIVWTEKAHHMELLIVASKARDRDTDNYFNLQGHSPVIK